MTEVSPSKRRPLIAGNWKMNLNRLQSAELVNSILSALAGRADAGVDVAVFPPAVYLEVVAGEIRKSGRKLPLGAQNVCDQPNGAFTGEWSCEMLLDLGATMSILGHSERRALMGETSEQVNAKAKRCLQTGVTPLVCIGETLDQREAGSTMAVVLDQCEKSLADLDSDQILRVVIAYEPVWAIGTGKVATPEQAEEVHAEIRAWLDKKYGSNVAQSVRILYGGSVKPDNAAELLGQANIDGALVGGASLKAESFIGIVDGAVKVAV